MARHVIMFILDFLSHNQSYTVEAWYNTFQTIHTDGTYFYPSCERNKEECD